MTESESIEQFESLAHEEQTDRIKSEYEAVTVPAALNEYFADMERTESE